MAATAGSPTPADTPAARGAPGTPDAPGVPGAPDRSEVRPTVALVLGSGGARGLAHIGVVEVLQEHGMEVVAVSGSSMGALVGGMLAAGRLAEYTEWVLGLGRFEVLRLMDVSLSSPGAMRGDKVFGVVGELLGGTRIEDLPVAYTAVAVDLLAHREVWFQEGPLDVAVRASAAIPSFFAPVTLNGRMLVDGGLLDPVPVAPVSAARADRVIAVSLNGRDPATDRPVAESTEEVEVAEWSDRLRGRAARWFDSDLLATVRRRLPPDVEDSVRSRLVTEPGARSEVRSESRSESKPDGLSTVEVMQMSYEAMQGAITRHRLAAYPPDLLVSVPRNAARTLDFHRAAELIELGRRLAEEALVGLPTER